jgi:hypothetical protein
MDDLRVKPRRHWTRFLWAPLLTALALDSIVLFRLLGDFREDELTEFWGVLLNLTLVGLAAGTVPTALWQPLRRLGYPGSLLNGVVTMNCYLLACAWAFGKLPRDAGSLGLMLGLGVLFGLVVGHSIIHTLVTGLAELDSVQPGGTWGPVDLARWREVPHMAGSVAGEQDVIDGRAVFYIQAPADIHVASLHLPALALLRLDGEDEQPVVVIQAEILDGATTAGVRLLGGGNAVCTLDELEFIDEDDSRLVVRDVD